MTAPRDQALEWVHFAGEDLRAAQLLAKEGMYSLACFHAQQCAEKSLKAIVIRRGGSLKRIHDLNELLKICRSLGESMFDDVEDGITALNAFYAPMRYPDGIPGSLVDRMPGKGDATEALKIAEDIYSAVMEAISQP